MPVSFSGIRSTSAIGVAQGGTGASELTEGGVLIGHGTNPVTSITGSDGQVLTWSAAEGAWIAAEPAAGSGGSGGGIASVTTSGNLQGSGTAGSPVTLKANISLTSVTASFSGNGSQISNLTASQISGLDAAVDARITNIPNAALQNSSITVNGQAVSLGGTVTIATVDENPSFTSITAATGAVSGDLTVGGNLYVNGAQTVVNTTDLTITDNVILIASGAVNAAQLDGAGIHFGRLPSEDARIIYDSVNDWMEVYPGVSASLYTGNGAGLVNIPNTALQNSSIMINGSAVSLGGSTTIADQSYMSFTASGFAVGDVVALSGSLVKADYSDDTKSNAFGVVSAVAGTNVSVKVFGEVTALSASNYATAGTLVYVGPSGSVVNYSGIPSGKYVTQVGIISTSSGKVIIQPRVFGQK